MSIKSQAPPQALINSVIELYSNNLMQEALDAVETLIKDYSNEAVLYNISGACYAAQGQLDTAVKRYEQSLNINPYYAEAHNNLGGTLHELGQLDEAVKSYEQALAIKPDYAEAFNNLGIALKELGQLDTAVVSYKKILTIKPDFAEAHYNLAITLHELGQLDNAVKSYEKALAVKPDYAEAFNNLGIALKELGQLDDSVKSYEKALAVKPDYADTHYNLGLTLQRLGQIDEAVKSYEQALAIEPEYAEAFNNLGIALKELGQLDEAVKSYEQALAIKPDYAEAFNNLGIALKELGQLDDAVKSYKQALAIKPNYAEAHYNVGLAIQDFGQLDEALVSFDNAIVLKPDIDFALGILLHTKMHLCIWDDLPSYLNELTKKINNSEKVIIPFALLALIDNPEIQRKNAEIFANENHPKNHVLSKIEPYPKHIKIRIGYFSSDFRIHPVSDLTAELYEIHDRNQFEIHAFSFGPDTKDEMNLRIKAGVDYFHDVLTMSHKEVVMLTRSVELDIAVDLGGYTQNSRTKIFAMSAAPIQVSFLGYAGTMGIDYMDYLIADHTLIPKDRQHHYSEKIAYLPNSFMVNDTKNKVLKKVFTRAETGLPINGFVFCCFNNHYKITPNIFIGWMRILSQVDGSVLWLSEANSTAVNNLKKEAKKNGVDENRLIFAPRLTFKEDHLSRIQLADLFIDTQPYNAHVTASDALRMGLPVLTCIGNSFASRVAASLLNAVNLPELITTSQEQYESLAIQLALNQEKLIIIKDKLVNNLPTAPLYDTPLFIRHLESAYLSMYDRYQHGLDPDHIYVEDHK
jgi:protein O-GlcNAc transferase